MSLLCGGTVFGHWAHLGSLMARLTILGINTCQEEEDMYQVWHTRHCRGYESVALVCDNMSMGSLSVGSLRGGGGGGLLSWGGGSLAGGSHMGVVRILGYWGL